MEQAPDQVVERQIRIGQLLGLHRPAEDRDVRPVWMIEPRVQPFTPLFALRQMLEQQTAGEPMLTALLGCQSDKARYLLGLRKIALRSLAEVLPLQRNDALVALLRHRLVEGDREIALAEQVRECRFDRQVRQALRV